MHAKSSFFVLQALDLSTTLIAFYFGAFEVNPLVGLLITLFGPAGGVLASKVIAVLIALRLRKLIWVENLFLFWVSFAGTRLFCSFSPTVSRTLPIGGCDANVA